MRYLVNLLIILAILNPAIAASSTLCGPQSIEPNRWAKEAMKNGSAVFVGRVLSVKSVPQVDSGIQRPSDEAASMADLLELIKAGQADDFYDHIVSFKILRAWKDPAVPIVRAKVNLGPYATVLFAIEGDYLVIGRDAEDEYHWIRNWCNDVRDTQKSSAHIDALSNLTPVLPTGQTKAE